MKPSIQGIYKEKIKKNIAYLVFSYNMLNSN